MDSVTGDAASRSAALEWLGVQGHPGLARGAVTVLVATEPPVAAADPPVVVSFDEGSRAVVRVAFDPHLASTGIVDLAMLAGSTVAAVRELAKRVSGSGADDSPPPALTDRATGSLEGLRVPALVVDAPGVATGLPTPQVTSPATSAAPVGGRRRQRPGLTVVVCAVVAVVLAIFASGATGEDASASIAAACGSGSPGGQLPDHDGHPTAAASCVQTPFGAVSAQENNPTLLIVAAPSTITPGQDIELQVSVRNLVRDDFPTSAHGGYLSRACLPDLPRLHPRARAQRLPGAAQRAGSTPARPRDRVHGDRGRRRRRGTRHGRGAPARPRCRRVMSSSRRARLCSARPGQATAATGCRWTPSPTRCQPSTPSGSPSSPAELRRVRTRSGRLLAPSPTLSARRPTRSTGTARPRSSRVDGQRTPGHRRCAAPMLLVPGGGRVGRASGGAGR